MNDGNLREKRRLELAALADDALFSKAVSAQEEHGRYPSDDGLTRWCDDVQAACEVTLRHWIWTAATQEVARRKRERAAQWQQIGRGVGKGEGGA